MTTTAATQAPVPPSSRLQEAVAILMASNRANTTPSNETPAALPTVYDVVCRSLNFSKECLERSLHYQEFHAKMCEHYEEEAAIARSRIQEMEQKLRELEAKGQGPSRERETLDLQELQTRLAQLTHE